jgi:hypothetical protein
MRPWSHVKPPTPVTIQAITVPLPVASADSILFLERGRSHPFTTSVAAIEPARIPVLGPYPQRGDAEADTVDALVPATCGPLRNRQGAMPARTGFAKVKP